MIKNLFPWIQRFLSPKGVEQRTQKQTRSKQAQLSRRMPAKTIRQLQTLSRRHNCQPQSPQPSQPKTVNPTDETLTYCLSRSETIETLNRKLKESPEKSQWRAELSQGGHLAPNNRLISLADIAFLSAYKGNHIEAERLYEQELIQRKTQWGEHHPKVAITLRSLANLYCEQHRHTEAEVLLNKALGIQQQALPANHKETGETLYKLATLYCHQQRYSKSDACFQKALSIFRQQLGTDHPQTKAAYSDLMAMMAMLIEQDKFLELAADLPPLDLNNLSETYSWARPRWQQT